MNSLTYYSQHFQVLVHRGPADSGGSVSGIQHALIDGIDILAQLRRYHIASEDGVSGAMNMMSVENNLFQRNSAFLRGSHHDVF